MPQARENRSRVQLSPLSAPEAGPGGGWLRCRVLVTHAADVDGYLNLLAAELPREMDALVPAEDADFVSGGPQERLASLVAPHTLRTIPPSQL